MEILELKVIVTKMNYSLEGTDSRCELAEEIISKLEDRTIGIIQYEEQRLKKDWRKMNTASEKWGPLLSKRTYG